MATQAESPKLKVLRADPKPYLPNFKSGLNPRITLTHSDQILGFFHLKSISSRGAIRSRDLEK